MYRYLVCVIVFLSFVFYSDAQTPIVKPDFNEPTLVAPAYFGPNAFPVPDMSDGTTSDKLRLELAADAFLGSMTSNPTDDVTLDLFAKATIPLFTKHVNLVVWMPVVEWFRSGPEVNQLRRLGDYDRWASGMDSGDAYVGTDILILDESKRGCGLVLRSVLKSASGNSYHLARAYDSPGYYFDLTVGRNLVASADGEKMLRVALTTGFLCWQTANARQNDAVMYGALASLKMGPAKMEVNYGGYVGWEGIGDRPMTLKAKMSWAIKNFSIDAMYHIGFMDWPFHQLRIGTTYEIPLSLRK